MTRSKASRIQAFISNMLSSEWQRAYDLAFQLKGITIHELVGHLQIAKRRGLVEYELKKISIVHPKRKTRWIGFWRLKT